MRFLGSIEFAILSAGGFLSEQRRRQSLFDQRLADPVHRGGATRYGFSDPCVVPARTGRTHVAREQNSGVKDRERRPFSGAD